MPIYEYKCKSKLSSQPTVDCDHVYEVFYKSFSAVEHEEPLEACPKCGGRLKERKLSQGTSHVFKSGKWFKEGY